MSGQIDPNYSKEEPIGSSFFDRKIAMQLSSVVMVNRTPSFGILRVT